MAKDKAKSTNQHSFGSGLRDLDTPITKLGEWQARATGEHLARERDFDTVFTSSYRRTVQTAEQILDRQKASPLLVPEELIREIEFGILDGLTSEGIRAKYPDEFARREREGKYWYRPLGGESRPDVALRVQSFLGTLTRDYRQKTVLVICHSVVVLIFQRLLGRAGVYEN